MGKKILIIDDDADDRDLFKEALQEIDDSIQCISAKNGPEAINLLISQQSLLPDYIFLDLNMPRMSGKQCLAQLKHMHHVKHVPVVIFTTSKQRDDKEEVEKLGAIGYITKPPRFTELVKQLSDVLSIEWHEMR